MECPYHLDCLACMAGLPDADASSWQMETLSGRNTNMTDTGISQSTSSPDTSEISLVSGRFHGEPLYIAHCTDCLRHMHMLSRWHPPCTEYRLRPILRKCFGLLAGQKDCAQDLPQYTTTRCFFEFLPMTFYFRS